MEKAGCKVICGAPTTVAVKGLMTMMMMMMMIMMMVAKSDSSLSFFISPELSTLRAQTHSRDFQKQ